VVSQLPSLQALPVTTGFNATATVFKDTPTPVATNHDTVPNLLVTEAQDVRWLERGQNSCESAASLNPYVEFADRHLNWQSWQESGMV
jgi:hypothetical protein